MSRRFLLYLIAANLIGAFFLWLAARELPFEKIGDILGAFSTEHLIKWTVVFCVLYLVTHLARVVRWYELLRAIGDVDRSEAYRVCAVGFLAILILPLRLGEFVRPYLISRRSNISTSAALGTVVVERVLDGLIITGLLFATLTAYSAKHEATVFATSLAMIAAAIFVPAFVVCVFAMVARERARALVDFCFSLFPSIGEKVNSLLDAFIAGIESMRSSGAIVRFFVFTAIYWGLNGFSMYVLARFGFGFDISLWDGFTLLAILVIGIMLPAGPAMAGNYEYFVGKGMVLFTADTAGIAAFSASMHVLQFIVIVLPGIAVLWFDRSTRDVFRVAMDDQAESEQTSDG